MDKSYCKDVSCILNLFSEIISDVDIIYSDFIAKISICLTSERLKRNMSQTEFAELLGMSLFAILDIESGNYEFTLKELVHISSCLDLNLKIELL